MDSTPPLISIVDPLIGLAGRDGLFQIGAVLKAAVVDSDPSGQARLKIGGRVIPVIVSREIRAGGEIRLRVAQVEPRVTLEVLPEPTTESESLKQPAKTSLGGGSPLRNEGLVLRARILSLPGNGRIKIRITSPPLPSRPSPRASETPADPGGRGFEPAAPEMPDHSKLSGRLSVGREITARLQTGDRAVPLKVNQETSFLVAETSPHLVLRIAEGGPPAPYPPQFIKALGALFSEPARFCTLAASAVEWLEAEAPDDLRQINQALAALIKEMSPAQSGPDSEFAGRLFRHFGLSGRPSSVQEGIVRFFEESLVLSQAHEDRPGLRKALETAARVFEAIDQVQTANRGLFSEQRTLYVPFPLFWGDPSERGELGLELPPGEAAGSGERPVRISLLLDMTRLGRMKVDLELKGRTINGTFLMESRDARDRMERFVERLRRSLEARNFSIDRLSFQVSQPERPVPETLLPGLAPRDRGLISIRV